MSDSESNLSAHSISVSSSPADLETSAQTNSFISSVKGKFIQILKPGIAVVLLIILARSGLLKAEQLKASLQDPTIIGLGFLLLSFQMTFFAVRWKYFVNQHVSFGLLSSLRQTSLGLFFNFFIPGGVGGDIVKAMDLSKLTKVPKGTSVSLIFLDRILGLYAMITFAFIFLTLELFISGMPNLTDYVIVSGVIFTIATTGITFAKFISNKLNQVRYRFEKETLISKIVIQILNLTEKVAFGMKLKNLSWALVFSFFAQLFSILFLHYVCSRLAPEEMANFSFFLFFPLACFAFMATAIPIAPGGVGLGQASFYLIFSSFNQTIASQLVIAVSLLQLFQLLFGLIGGIMYFRPLKAPKKLA